MRDAEAIVDWRPTMATVLCVGVFLVVYSATRWYLVEMFL